MIAICMAVGKRILDSMECIDCLAVRFQPYEDRMTSVGTTLPLPSESYFQISFTSCLLGVGD